MLKAPNTKQDIEAAEKIVAAGMPEVEPILKEVVEWFQDINWPVAQVLVKLMPKMGEEILPHIRFVL